MKIALNLHGAPIGKKSERQMNTKSDTAFGSQQFFTNGGELLFWRTFKKKNCN